VDGDASVNSRISLLGSGVSKKRKREYADGPKDGSIPKPPGTAGKGGGLGYNLQGAMGLSGTENEQIYRSLLVSTIHLMCQWVIC
jgi:hypothetical protein